MIVCPFLVSLVLRDLSLLPNKPKMKSENELPRVDDNPLKTILLSVGEDSETEIVRPGGGE